MATLEIICYKVVNFISDSNPFGVASSAAVNPFGPVSQANRIPLNQMPTSSSPSNFGQPMIAQQGPPMQGMLQPTPMMSATGNMGPAGNPFL